MLDITQANNQKDLMRYGHGDGSILVREISWRSPSESIRHEASDRPAVMLPLPFRDALMPYRLM